MQTLTINKYSENGIDYTEQVFPDGWVVVDSHIPTHTIVPWDYYGQMHQVERCGVLMRGNIPTLEAVTRRERTHPVGTGPSGAVRFGDDMMPSVYRIAVPAAHAERAIALLMFHDSQVRDWLAGGAKPTGLLPTVAAGVSIGVQRSPKEDNDDAV